MDPNNPHQDIRIWVVTNQVVEDGKIIFGTPFRDQCDRLSLKPPQFTWIGTTYTYGVIPPASEVNAVTLDTEFFDADEIDKFFVPYLPQTINAAQDADISPKFSH